MEYKDELRPKSTKSWFSFFTAPSPVLLPNDHNEFPELVSAHAWQAAYKSKLSPATNSADDLSYSSRIMAAVERETMHELHSWRDEPGIGPVFSCLAKGLARSQLQHHVRAQASDRLVSGWACGWGAGCTSVSV